MLSQEKGYSLDSRLFLSQEPSYSAITGVLLLFPPLFRLVFFLSRVE
jgi:hypothetical protein